MDAELIIEPIDDERHRFKMRSICVDGICGSDNKMYGRLLFSLKDEEDAKGNPIHDGVFRWRPDVVVDEELFLRTGEIVTHA